MQGCNEVWEDDKIGYCDTGETLTRDEEHRSGSIVPEIIHHILVSDPEGVEELSHNAAWRAS